MRELNEKHEVIIESIGEPDNDILLSRSVNRGEVIPHKRKVTSLYYYSLVDNRYEKIYLSRSMIVDLFNDIMRIENTPINLPYNPLPF